MTSAVLISNLDGYAREQRLEKFREQQRWLTLPGFYKQEDLVKDKFQCSAMSTQYTCKKSGHKLRFSADDKWTIQTYIPYKYATGADKENYKRNYGVEWKPTDGASCFYLSFEEAHVYDEAMKNERWISLPPRYAKDNLQHQNDDFYVCTKTGDKLKYEHERWKKVIVTDEKLSKEEKGELSNFYFMPSSEVDNNPCPCEFEPEPELHTTALPIKDSRWLLLPPPFKQENLVVDKEQYRDASIWYTCKQTGAKLKFCIFPDKKWQILKETSVVTAFVDLQPSGIFLPVQAIASLPAEYNVYEIKEHPQKLSQGHILRYVCPKTQDDLQYNTLTQQWTIVKTKDEVEKLQAILPSIFELLPDGLKKEDLADISLSCKVYELKSDRNTLFIYDPFRTKQWRVCN